MWWFCSVTGQLRWFCFQTSAEKVTCIENEVKDMAMLNDGLREKITFLAQVPYSASGSFSCT